MGKEKTSAEQTINTIRPPQDAAQAYRAQRNGDNSQQRLYRNLQLLQPVQSCLIG